MQKNKNKYDLGLGLWCLTPFSTIFQLSYFSGQFYWGRISEETTDLSQITDNDIILYCVKKKRIYFHLTYVS
jgi:hypothetical protein